MSAITICNGVFLHTPHFLLLECFVRQVQVFTSFIAGLKRASESWSCWLLVELLGLFDGRIAGVQKLQQSCQHTAMDPVCGSRVGVPPQQL